MLGGCRMRRRRPPGPLTGPAGPQTRAPAAPCSAIERPRLRAWPGTVGSCGCRASPSFYKPGCRCHRGSQAGWGAKPGLKARRRPKAVALFATPHVNSVNPLSSKVAQDSTCHSPHQGCKIQKPPRMKVSVNQQTHLGIWTFPQSLAL